MRERVEMVDGSLQIKSGSDGTKVSAVLPVRRELRGRPPGRESMQATGE